MLDDADPTCGILATGVRPEAAPLTATLCPCASESPRTQRGFRGGAYEMKKIQYSVSLMKNPIKGTTKAYGNLQLTGVVSIDELAAHMAEHNTVFSKGTIVGVLSDLGGCMRELILQGYKIQLGHIGSFEPTITTKGQTKVEDFSAQDITDMKVNFELGSDFDNLLRDAQFEKTSTRATQKKAIADETAEKAAKLAALTAEEPGEGEGGESQEP